MSNPLMNAAGISASQLGMAAQGTILGQQQAYNQTLLAHGQLNQQARDYAELATRLLVQVDVVSNGFVLAVGKERLIAKDLEELQQHFTAQVANMLLEKAK